MILNSITPVDHHACYEQGQVPDASFTKICAIAAESPSITLQLVG
jgi:hypothetical protein